MGGRETVNRKELKMEDDKKIVVENQEIDYKAEYEKAKAEAEKAKAEADKYKQAISKVNSENAEWKRKLQERMTAEEQQAEALAEKEKYYKSLERKLSLSEYNNKLSASIGDEQTRLEIAELLADGKNLEAIEKQNAYLSAYKETLTKQIREELLTQNPTPQPQVKLTETIDISKMGYKELNQFQRENPELYAKLKNK